MTISGVRDYGQLTHSSVPSVNVCRFHTGSRDFTSSTSSAHAENASCRVLGGHGDGQCHVPDGQLADPVADGDRPHAGVPRRPRRRRPRPRRPSPSGWPTYSRSRTPRPWSWSRTTPANVTTAPAAASATRAACSSTDTVSSVTVARSTRAGPDRAPVGVRMPCGCPHVVATGQLVHGVVQQRRQHAEAVLDAAGRAGQVHHERPARHPGHAPGQHGRGHLRQAGGPDRVGDAGHLVVQDRAWSPPASGRWG